MKFVRQRLHNLKTASTLTLSDTNNVNANTVQEYGEFTKDF